MRDKAPFARDDLLKHLNAKRIGTRLLFGGNLIRQPYMKGRNYRVFGETENSDKIMHDCSGLGFIRALEVTRSTTLLKLSAVFAQAVERADGCRRRSYRHLSFPTFSLKSYGNTHGIMSTAVTE